MQEKEHRQKKLPQSMRFLIFQQGIFSEQISRIIQSLEKKAKTYMDQGLLVPDELTVDLVIDRVQQEDCAKGYILDGFPRTIPQAESLDAALAKNGSEGRFRH